MAGRVVSSKATKFYTYSRTARSNTEYATKMKRLSNQIFGEVSEEFGLVIFSNNVSGETPHEWFTSCPRPKVCQWAFGAEWSLGMLHFFQFFWSSCWAFRSLGILASRKLQNSCAILGTMACSGRTLNVCVSCQNRDRLLRILLESNYFRDEHADFKDEMARLRQLRGKVKIRYFSLPDLPSWSCWSGSYCHVTADLAAELHNSFSCPHYVLIITLQAKLEGWETAWEDSCSQVWRGELLSAWSIPQLSGQLL